MEKYKEILKESDISHIFNENTLKSYKSIIEDIENLKTKEKILISIEGMSHSGKSTLGLLLSLLFSGALIRMDDFFLTDTLRTKERLREIGGNVDYERFKTDVLPFLGEDFSYPIYNCQTKSMDEKNHLKKSKFTIIEGIYSNHPTFKGLIEYDYKIFLEVDDKNQKERVKIRSLPMYDRFIEEWIPKENLYIKKYEIKEKADRVLNTSHFF